jgi:predicted MFS family arabinose efflux permease
VLFLGAAAFSVCVALLPPLAASQNLLAVTVLAILVSTLGSMPVSPMVTLPAETLRPDRRAIGLGLFYTWFYIGTAVCPPLGGWLYDLAGTPAAPIYLNAVLGIATIALYALFVGLERMRRVQ